VLSANPHRRVKSVAGLTEPVAAHHISRMVAALEHRQRIARLTPLEDVTRRIAECVGPVAPHDVEAAAALGATVAQDIAAGEPRPSAPLALIDGWAVHAELTAYADAYTPAVLTGLREIAVGEALGGNGDAVAPLEAVNWRGGAGELPTAELPMAMTPGDGVLLPGTDAGAGEVLWRSGHRLRASDIAAMQALGIQAFRVRRPHIRIARAWPGRRDGIADAIAGWLTSAVTAGGGEPATATRDAGVEALLTAGGVDAVMVIGGTGSGGHDGSVHALRQSGIVEAHGIAVSPGETAAFGMACSRPVLLIPGRLDAAVAVWLLIGRPLLARLCGGGESAAPPLQGVLTAKIASTVGLTELVLVRRTGDGVAPLASKYLPLATLAQADGWIVIPAASEGLAPGAPVTVGPLP
jgi:molybdopterin molybdotransferase